MGRTIRPSPRAPAPTPKQKMPTIPQAGHEAFDAAAHFKDYDHEAVKELSRNTLICPATYNRKGTVEVCLGATYRHRMEAKMYIHDDGSDEYDEKWLSQFADRVHCHPRSRGGKQGVKDLRSNITKSVMGNYKTEIFKSWLEQDFGPEGPQYLYMVDSDGYHDPHFFYRLHEIMNLYPEWGVICLYNAKFHSPRRNRVEGSPLDFHTVIRGMAAGISMFFRMQSFRDNPKHIQVPDRRGWDGFYSQTIGKKKVVTSLVSYVEHFGKWGFHNKGDFDRDKALNPTKHLADIRNGAITKIEAEFEARTKAGKKK